MLEIRSGIYRHYKGPLYMVLGLAHDSNADTLTVANDQEYWDEDNSRYIPLGERHVVVYVELNSDKSGPPMAVRTLENFMALVCTRPEHRHYGGTPDGAIVCNAVRRFEYVGTERPAPA